MTPFAKLYDTEFGQILCLLDLGHEDGDDPCVEFYARPGDLGVCKLKHRFDNSDRGAGFAQEFFDEITEAIAIRQTEPIRLAAEESE